MLHIIDDALPKDLLAQLRSLCDHHAALKSNHKGKLFFSWQPNNGPSQSLHPQDDRLIIERYLSDYLYIITNQFVSEQAGAEWWCNTNNDLDWHIDRDEAEAIHSGSYLLPLLSTVFYPHVSCAGGELLIADNTPIRSDHQGPLPSFRSVISVPPVINRLVIFSPGILHRINPFEGERYSVAVNIWEQAPRVFTKAPSWLPA